MAFFKRQAGAGNPSVWVHYLYDNDGNRIKKIVNKASNVQEVTVYIDEMYEYSYTKNSGTIDSNRQYNTLHILDGTSRIAAVRVGNDADDSTPAQKFFVEDHLGNASVVVQTNGNRINLEEYYPFGETSFGSYAKKRYRYNGKEKDEHTGLYEYGQRYYAPWLCRFVSVDPVAEDFPHLSAYNYASNRPVTARDLEGLQAADVSGESESNEDQIPEPTKVILGQGEQYLAVPADAGITYDSECGRACQIDVDNVSYTYNSSTNSFEDENGTSFSNSIIYEAKVSEEFKKEVLAVSYRLKTDPNMLMAVMAFETGETFSPSIQNGAGAQAFGLIQFMNIAIKDINKSMDQTLTLDSVKNMSAETQLEVVEMHFKMWQDRGKNLATVSDFYMTVFSPKYAGKPDSTEMYSFQGITRTDTLIDPVSQDTTLKTVVTPNKKSPYYQNRGLDTNQDSTITKAEAASKVTEKLIRGQKFMNKK